MEIAVTGGSGRLGKVVVHQLLDQGYNVRSLDWTAPQAMEKSNPALAFKLIDLSNLEALREAFRGCEAVIHLAAYPGPQGHPPGEVYTNNTRASYNMLYAASSLGIRHVCQASSVNALGGMGSDVGRYEYLPVDEKHPTFNMDDYSLSKWIMEQQADSFARRFPKMTISSLRFHALPDETPELQTTHETSDSPGARGLWGWTLVGEAARACVLAVTQASFTGHEVFFIVAPATYSAIPSLELARYTYPNLPIRGDLSGHKSLIDCSKAARFLGWIHK